MIKEIERKRGIILAIVIILLIISNYIFITMATIQSININENWRLLLGEDIVPLDIKIMGQSIILLTINDVFNELTLYNISLNGGANWVRKWTYDGNATLLPLRLEILSHRIYVPVLINNRHHLALLVINENGHISDSYEVVLSNIIGIYDTIPLNASTLLIAGTRYKAGYRLQYYIGLYNVKNKELINISVWGTNDNDILTQIIYANHDKLAVLGNSTGEGQKIYILNYDEDTIYKQSIDGTVLSNCIDEDNIYVLHIMNNKYYMTSIRMKELSSKTTLLKSLQQELIRELNTISKYKDYFFLMGSALNTEYGTVYGVIYVLDENYTTLKAIWIGNPDQETVILTGTNNNDILLVSGLFGDKIFIISYTLSVESINWDQMLPYIIINLITVALIVVILYIIKKRK
ncbi:MAG: hypothetical protein J7L82_07040 [Staphylothermus sp.]|nr:hypothetical protein [Staphylothermus sp.]